MSKRTLDAFFKPPTKRVKPDESDTHQHQNDQHHHDHAPPDTHPTYPHPIAKLPAHIEKALAEGTPARKPKIMNDQADLDCLYFQPYIPRSTANDLFRFLRTELPFYRVNYFAKRGGVDVEIKTPRFTTVFGVDEGCFFAEGPVGKGYSDNELDHDINANASADINDIKKDDQKASSLSTYTPSALTLQKKEKTSQQIKYGHDPRPIPSSLHALKRLVESATETTYNFVLVNYYASGEDSIAFHSDDERFLGFEPAIASLSLGAEREFLLKHKPVQIQPGTGSGTAASSTSTSTSTSTIKLPLASGDMILMRGRTQSNWLHSIPKRKGKSIAAEVGGRINITFRKAVIPAGTDNYYHYNVGTGPVWRWDEVKREMVEGKSQV